MRKLMDIIEGKIFKISSKYFTSKPIEKGLLVDYARKLGGQKGSGNEEGKIERGMAFGTVFDFLLYAFLLGVRLNKYEPIQEKEQTEAPFQTIRDSGQKRIKIIQFIVMILLTKSQKELIDIEQMNEKELEDFAKELITMLEGYANGGFEIISLYREDNEQYFEDTNNFVNFLTDSQEQF
ncbi:MAG: hypothetical protein MUE81_00135 [Thermoflexibacter sp.]|jgi:hypothetical protein|nr:hypothetical protein [Thermoflexibacter sp.]